MRFRIDGNGIAARQVALASLCLFALAFSACYLPPFDEKLVESERFAAGLALVGRLGPVYMDDRMYEGGYFLPSRSGMSPADGYWLRRNGTELMAAYMSSSSIHAGSHTPDNALADGFVAFPLTEEEVAGLSGSTPQRGLLAIFGSRSTCMPALGTDALLNMTLSLNPVVDSTLPEGSIIGGSCRIESPSTDGAYVLYRSSDTPLAFTGGWTSIPSSCALASAGLSFTTGAVSGAIPSLRPGAFFGYCADNSRYYVSGYPEDGSPLYSAYWAGGLGSTATALPTLPARIAAILSTGQLLLVGDGAMYLYSADGNPDTSFTTGSMHFAYEYCDDDGLWYCYFTRAVRASGDNGGKVTVDVYRCRSDSLAKLGD